MVRVDLLVHFTGSHRKLTMTNATLARDVTVYWNVIGWIGKDQIRLLILEEPLVRFFELRVGAHDNVSSTQPCVSRPSD